MIFPNKLLHLTLLLLGQAINFEACSCTFSGGLVCSQVFMKLNKFLMVKLFILVVQLIQFIGQFMKIYAITFYSIDKPHAK